MKQTSAKPVQSRASVVVRFVGDSGDGMQVTGSRLTIQAALAGNDVATWPDYPAEIRAPAGTLAGVSGFQLHFADHDIHTPGDVPDVLVALNPAALKANLADLPAGAMLIVDRDSFTTHNLQKAGYTTSPLDDGSLAAYQVFALDVGTMTTRALDGLGLPTKAAARCRNFFCLGIVSWLFTRPLETVLDWIAQKFQGNDTLWQANTKALKAGHFFAETTELFATAYEIRPAALPPGTYRNVTGAETLALGLLAAAERAGRTLFFGAYPITPASELLHTLARYKTDGVVTFQAEDEIAAIGAALGAAFGGAIGVTATSGPGMDLKSEMLGLAGMVELPLVVIDVQRAGPSTGMPTKTEQSDLQLALCGRHGELPLPVLAPASAAECFSLAYEAVRWAVQYMTPVILLSDTTLANGAEPWRLPALDALPAFPASAAYDASDFAPYRRDPHTLARAWMTPGQPGGEHRIGGLEKADVTGAVSYDPVNHERMTALRAEKIARIAREIPPTVVHGDALGLPSSRSGGQGDLLVIGWGSTFGVIRAAVDQLCAAGHRVSQVHLRHVQPLPPDLASIVARFATVVVPELNMGQCARWLRAELRRDIHAITKVQGRPFQVRELVERLLVWLPAAARQVAL